MAPKRPDVLASRRTGRSVSSSAETDGVRHTHFVVCRRAPLLAHKEHGWVLRRERGIAMSIDEPRQLDDEQIEEVAGGLAWRSNNRHVLSRSQPKR